LEPKIHKGSLSAKDFRFAIVESRWNELLTSKLTAGALDALERLGAEDENVEVFKVPGSFELPLTAKKVAMTGKFDAVICIGVVIRGETPHFDYVAGEAAKGIAQAAMSTNVPVLFGVVTADTVEQALNRCGIKSGNKGFDAAMSAVEIVSLLKEVGDKEAGGDATFPHAV
jgi:6,7-dimethyl-8-ribityllumazine synthase